MVCYLRAQNFVVIHKFCDSSQKLLLHKTTNISPHIQTISHFNCRQLVSLYKRPVVGPRSTIQNAFTVKQIHHKQNKLKLIYDK